MTAPTQPTEAKPLALEILAAEQFATREAVRAFVAGPAFAALANMVSEALVPAPDPVPDELLDLARAGADFLVQDLAGLAQLAAQLDEAAFVPPIPQGGVCRHSFTQRASWLGALGAVSAAAGWVDEIASNIARTLAQQLEAVQEEECGGDARADEASP